jgi:YidC/Oxa1 family membrane protein insertase
MNKQDTLRNLLVAAAVVVLVLAIGPLLFPPPPPRPAASPDASIPGLSEQDPTMGSPLTPGPPAARPPGEPAPADSTFVLQEADSAQTFELGAKLSAHQEGDWRTDPYRMGLTVSNVGAAIESALLTDHGARLDSPQRYPLLTPLPRSDGAILRSLAVDKINIDGSDVVLHDKKWHSEGVEEYKSGSSAGQTVQFRLDIQRGDQPGLRLLRTWRLPRQPEELGRHDVYSELSVQNLTDQPSRVVITYRGGVGVPQEHTTDDRVVDIGVRAGPEQVVGTRKLGSQAAANAGKPLPLFIPISAQPDQRLSWAATANTYFTCTIAPLGADGKSPAPYLAEVSLLDADADATTSDDATVRFVTLAAVLQPAATLTYPAELYMGEKDGRSFRKEPDYIARNYYYQISQGFGWCTFTWLVELMIWLLNSLFFVVRDFGVAIIILVLLVRALLHPLTKKGQVNMAKMQHRMTELAPKIEELKKKYANDKVRLNQEMMKLNLNPAGQLMSCLPMLIQMPIWVALFLSLSNNILMRHQPFLFTWIKDLTAPDALIAFSSPLIVPVVGWRIASFNVLPILVSLFMYLQQKTAPKPPVSPSMSAEQRQQQEMMQKMMPLMSIMMLLIFYNMPSGLNLYIMFSSLFGWLEQVVIRKHIKQQEAAGVFRSTPPKPPDEMNDRGPKSAKMTWFNRLQKMAEEAQKAQHTQRAAKPRR